MTAIEEADCASIICRWYRVDRHKIIFLLRGAMAFAEGEVEDELDFLFEFEMTRREMALEAKHG